MSDSFIVDVECTMIKTRQAFRQSKGLGQSIACDPVCLYASQDCVAARDPASDPPPLSRHILVQSFELVVTFCHKSATAVMGAQLRGPKS